MENLCFQCLRALSLVIEHILFYKYYNGPSEASEYNVVIHRKTGVPTWNNVSAIGKKSGIFPEWMTQKGRVFFVSTQIFKQQRAAKLFAMIHLMVVLIVLMWAARLSIILYATHVRSFSTADIIWILARLCNVYVCLYASYILIISTLTHKLNEWLRWNKTAHHHPFAFVFFFYLLLLLLSWMRNFAQQAECIQAESDSPWFRWKLFMMLTIWKTKCEHSPYSLRYHGVNLDFP